MNDKIWGKWGVTQKVMFKFMGGILLYFTWFPIRLPVICQTFANRFFPFSCSITKVRQIILKFISIYTFTLCHSFLSWRFAQGSFLMPYISKRTVFFSFFTEKVQKSQFDISCKTRTLHQSYIMWWRNNFIQGHNLTLPGR